VPARKETISFGRGTGTPSQKQHSNRLYKQDEGASSGFGSLMSKKRSAPGSSESYPFAASESRPRGGQRGPRDERKRTHQAPRDESKQSVQGSQRRAPSRERAADERSDASTSAPRVQQLRPSDYAPVRPRGQDDLFGTTSLLDIDVAEMNQAKGDTAEYAETGEAVPAHRSEQY
jgi:hypothetical protein